MDKNNLKIKDKILATDIDEEILNRARKGKYKENEIKNLEKTELKKYFLYFKFLQDIKNPNISFLVVNPWSFFLIMT